MEDYEVRQALAIIKDRVNELTNKPDWKEQMANEWNEANQEEAAAKQARKAAAADRDTQSQVTYRKSIKMTVMYNKLLCFLLCDRIPRLQSIEGQLCLPCQRSQEERG